MINVANRLRMLRETAGVSQRELARRTDVSNGTISQIEQGNSDPSVSLLMRILAGIDVTVGDFFDESHQTESRVFYFKNDFVNVGSGSVAFFQMGPKTTGRQMQFLREVFKEGGSTGPSPIVHEGEEAGIITKGKLEVTVGDQRRTLSSGDGYYFNSRIPHSFRNVGEGTCEVISACTPPF